MWDIQGRQLKFITGKLCHRTDYEGPKREKMYRSTLTLTSAPDGDA
jgi:hypothetical protein